MMTLYCPKCAEKNFYTLVRPVFCMFCGTKLDGTSVAKVKNKEIREQIKDLEILDDEPVVQERKSIQQQNAERLKQKRLAKQKRLEEDEDVEIPDISNLEFEIIGEKQTLTFGKLTEQGKTGFAPRPVENLSKEEHLKQFYEEARGKSSPIEIGGEEDDD